MPKSGSSWLTRILQDLLDWPELRLECGHNGRENDIFVPRLLKFSRRNVFTPHLHLRASADTLEIVKQFRIMPIVQTRNLFDVVISYSDFYGDRGFNASQMVFPSGFGELSEEQKIDAIIDLAMPWYIHFYVSWFYAEQKHGCRIHWVRYEDMHANACQTVRRVLDFMGESKDEATIQEVLASSQKKQTLKNVGVMGRGEGKLSEEQKNRIRRMAHHYPDVDFSGIGL